MSQKPPITTKPVTTQALSPQIASQTERVPEVMAIVGDRLRKLAVMSRQPKVTSFLPETESQFRAILRKATDAAQEFSYACRSDPSSSAPCEQFTTDYYTFLAQLLSLPDLTARHARLKSVRGLLAPFAEWAESLLGGAQTSLETERSDLLAKLAAFPGDYDGLRAPGPEDIEKALDAIAKSGVADGFPCLCGLRDAAIRVAALTSIYNALAEFDKFSAALPKPVSPDELEFEKTKLQIQERRKEFGDVKNEIVRAQQDDVSLTAELSRAQVDVRSKHEQLRSDQKRHEQEIRAKAHEISETTEKIRRMEAALAEIKEITKDDD
jgi:hypothetical protein